MSITIGSYIIEEDEEFGSGGYGQIYLAKKEGETEGQRKLYVIKIPFLDNMTEDEISTFNNEIDIIKILSKIPKNTYTSVIYDYNKIKDEEEKEENEANKEVVPFYTMDFFSKGLLFDYAFPNNLTLKLAKYIFQKIIKGFQFLHENGICHLDIKTENIIFDKDFWPVIIDFGFAKKYKNDKGEMELVTVGHGTHGYIAPEIYRKEPINAEKADIFSLGVVLFNLVTGKKNFKKAIEEDILYNLIIKKNYEEYWQKIQQENLSDNFKNLYQKMVAYEPGDRPSFNEILNDPWLEDLSNLSKEEEDGIKDDLNEIYENNIKDIKEITIKKKISSENLKTRGGNDEFSIFPKEKIEQKKYLKIE